MSFLSGIPLIGGIVNSLFGNDEDAGAKNTLSIDISNSLKILNETLVMNQTSTVVTVYNINTATLEIAQGGVVNGNVNVTQSIDMKNETSGKLDSSVLTSLSSKLITDLQVAADQAANSTAEWFSTSTAAAENVSVVKNAMEQAVTDRLSVTNYQSILSQTFNLNDGKIMIRGTVNGDVEIKQGIVATIISTNVLSSIINKTNDILQQSGSNIRVTQNSTSTAKGLNSVIDSWVGGITTSSIISAVILCIIILSLLVVALSPSGQKGISQASNVAASRYGGASIK